MKYRQEPVLLLLIGVRIVRTQISIHERAATQFGKHRVVDALSNRSASELQRRVCWERVWDWRKAD
jgi:hypothetical protein